MARRGGRPCRTSAATHAIAASECYARPAQGTGSVTLHSPGFGELLRRYRVAAGLTQEALADKAGLSVRGLSDLERGLRQSPHPESVQRLADALRLRREDRLALAASTVPVVVSEAAESTTQPAAFRDCGRCERRNTADARFCVGCGQALVEPIQVGLNTPAIVRPAPSSSIGVEGEHKLATLLCCQVTDTAVLAEHLGAEGLLALMDHFFQEAEAEIERFEGTIGSFLNDGFVALFGAPVAHEDHARRAVLAALGIQRRLREPWAPSGPPAGDAPTAWRALLRMALHTGPVAVGRLGSGSSSRPTAVGEAASLATLLQQRTEPGMIVISGATARLVTGYVRLEELGPVTLSGAARAVEAFRITGVGPRRSPIEGLGTRPLSRFVGREREMSTLHDLVEQIAGASEMDARPTLNQFIGRDELLAALRAPLAKVEAGHGQVVGVVGEPGIGKSRLVYEFRRSLAAKPLTYLEGRCLSYARNVPYVPVLDLVRANCGIQDSDEPELVAEKVRFGLQEVGLESDAYAPYLLHLLGVRDDASLAQLSAEAIKMRTFDALRTWSLRGCQQRPIIFVVEDLHWVDRSSEEYLASLVETLAGAHILLLCTWRPGYRPPWGDHSYVTQLALRRLNAHESLSIIRSALGTDRVPEGLARLILERAEGNPFFLEELTRAALEHGEVAAGTRVPETIQGVLMARMDRLPDTPRRVLQTASVLGRAVPLRLLGAIWQDATPLAPQLEELQRLEFLYAQAGQEPGYVFKHALTQDVAYESLLAGRRRLLHAAAGRAFEHLYADRLEEVYDRLAYHYGRTDEHDKAFTYLVRFAEQAARKYAHQDAVSSLREALRHLEGVSSDYQDHAWIDTAMRLAHSLYFLGRFPDTLGLLDGGRERLERVADARLIGPYHFWLSHTYSHVGDRKRTIEHAEQAIVEGERCGDAATVGRAHYVLARSAWWSGKNVWGVEHGRQAVAVLEQSKEQWWLAQSYCATGINYCWMGEFESAIEMATRGYAIGESIGDARIQSYALWNRGWYQAASGAAAAGIAACQQSLQQSPDPFNTTAATGWLGYAYLEARQPALAVACLEQSLSSWTQYEYGPLIGLFTGWLADALRGLGDLERSAQLAQRALDLSGRLEFWWAAGWAERVLGHIARQRGDPHAARDRLGSALRTYQSIHSRFEMARTLLALTELARDVGDEPQAERLLLEAHELFMAVGADQYLATFSAGNRGTGEAAPN